MYRLLVPLTLLLICAQQDYEIECDGDVTSWKEGDIKYTHLVGNVQIKTSTFTLKADSVLIKGKSDSMFEELFSKGHVLYNTKDTSMRCSDLYINIKQDKSIATNPNIRSFSKSLNLPIMIRAKEMKKTGPGTTEFFDAELSTCELASPHYTCTFSKVTLESTDTSKKDPFLNLHGDWKLTGYDFRLTILGLPVFYFPVLTFSSDQDFLLRGLKLGKSERFGYYQETLWGIDIKRGTINSLLGKPPTPDDRKDWGTLKFEIDHRQIRGWAGGIDLEYRDKGYHGYIDTYFLRDKGPNDSLDFEQKFIPLEDSNRNRFKFFHSGQINDQTRLELETSRLSDRNLLEEFFPKEFFEGKEQETAAFLRATNKNMGFYVYERHRVNDFQTQNEYLPRVKMHIFSDPVLPNIFLTSSLDAGIIKRRFDDALNLDPIKSARVDFINELSGEYQFGDVSFVPFTIGRVTHYDKDLEDNSRNRVVLTAGAKTNINFLANFGDLRHNINFDTRYVQSFNTDVHPTELNSFDEIENVDDFEELSFRLRNTLRYKDLEFFNLSLAMEYYPNDKRDTTFLNPNSFGYPFYYITNFLIPGETFKKRSISNLISGLTIRPINFLGITSVSEYNTIEKKLDTAQNGLNVSLGSLGWTSISHYYLRNGTDAYALGVNLFFSDRWNVSFQTQYDFNTKRFTTQSVKMIRDFHDITLDILYERNFNRNDSRFFVTLLPKILTAKKKR